MLNRYIKIDRWWNKLSLTSKDNGDYANGIQMSEIGLASLIHQKIYDPEEKHYPIRYFDSWKYFNACENKVNAVVNDSRWTIKDIQKFNPGDEYTRLKDAEIFVKNMVAKASGTSCETRIWINTKKQNAVILSNAHRKWYGLCALSNGLFNLFVRLCPWYFENKPLTEEEFEMCKAINDGNENELNKLIDKFVGKYCKNEPSGFESLFKRIAVANLEKRKKQIESKIKMIRDNLQNYYERYNNEIRNLSEANEELKNITVNEVNSKEIVEFIDSCNNVKVELEDDETVILKIDNYLDLVDSDALQSCWDASWTRPMMNTDSFWTCDRIKKFLQLIYVDRIAKVRTRSEFCWNPLEGTFRLNYLTWEEDNTRIPNPHHYYHRCLGSFGSHLMTALNDGNIIETISIAILSVSAMNILEGVTVCKFMNAIEMTNAPACIEYESEILTPMEFIKKIEYAEMEEIVGE